MGELHVGTSGWTYDDWRGIFYPEKLKPKDYFDFYARQFCTTEINSSFYHLPKLETFANWCAKAPEGFRFAVKASRLITHVRRLRDVREQWETFLKHAAGLGEKRGPVLLQLPPSFKRTDELLAGFLELSGELGAGEVAFEFRDPSWFHPDVLEIALRHRAALVIADSERYPQAPGVPTAGFVYLRFHGPGQMFSSLYTKEDLEPWAKRIVKWLAGGRDVYAYFNNDFEGHALTNARELRKLVGAASVQREAAGTR